MQKISEIVVSPAGSLVLLAGLGLAALQFLIAMGVELSGGESDAALFLGAAGLATVLVAILLFGIVRWQADLRAASPHDDQSSLPLSFFDTMTGIPNKLYFEDKVAAVLSAGQNGAIIVLDLADFAGVNDRRGRAFGDATIKETGRRLRNWAEASGGFAARLKGDRFGLFLPNVHRSELDALCEALIAVCREPVSKGGDVVEPRVSMGAVDFAGLGDLRALGFDSVMSVCNFALSTAKADGKGSYRIYDETLESQFVDLDAMAVELPNALRTGDLEVFLQPRCRLSDREMVGFEALVRWKRNDIYVAAEDLITMAEETGLIFELDRYMIDRAIQTTSDWNRRRKTTFPVSVNLSALHLRPDKGVEFIIDCLRRHNLPAEFLTIEVTETANLTMLDQVRGLASLREAGCRISIDDFGTGYASLARLRALPADEIKIDRLLISELPDSIEARYILKAVLSLAEDLEMGVVAEGIETEAQLDILDEAGCRFGQGFIFGHPRPALEWLADATYGPSGETPAASEHHAPPIAG